MDFVQGIPNLNMTDLAVSAALTNTSPQLPISWYFDAQVYALEQKHLFACAPGYVGHNTDGAQCG